MKAMYLYFVDTATPGRGPSSAPDGVRPAFDEGPLVAIQPGAFSRWKANRDRVVAENAAALRATVADSSLRHARGREATG